MEIFEEFRVPVPVDEAWRLLLDIERIAPCLPGAQLQEIEGDEYRGIVKVKVGPITAQYKGSAKFESTDDGSHTAVIVASGRDTRGQGNASATIQLALTAEDARTLVTVETELAITGKVAQFGRGVMSDVSSKLLAQFVENLERDVLSGDPSDAETSAGPDEPDGAQGDAEPTVDLTAEPGAGVTSNGSGPQADGGIRRIDGPAAAPVDLLAVGGQSVGKRLLPVGGLLLVLLVLLGIRRRRRRRS
jgi:carbon monoxide dehydrogenase subunit G